MRKCNWAFLFRFAVAICELDMMECTLRTLLLRLKTVIFELGLRERTSRTTFACRNLEMFQPELRDCTRAPFLYLKVAIIEAVCVLRLCLKLANFEPELWERLS